MNNATVSRRAFLAAAPLSPLAMMGIDLDKVDPKVKAAVIRAEVQRMVDDPAYRRKSMAQAREACGQALFRQLQVALVFDEHPELHRRPLMRRMVLKRIR